MPDPFQNCRYILGSNETGNVIDGGDDLSIMLCYLRRFKRTNMSVFDTQGEGESTEYWYTKGKLNKATLILTPD